MQQVVSGNKLRYKKQIIIVELLLQIYLKLEENLIILVIQIHILLKKNKFLKLKQMKL
jgi:hypothetical protein